MSIRASPFLIASAVVDFDVHRPADTRAQFFPSPSYGERSSMAVPKPNPDPEVDPLLLFVAGWPLAFALLLCDGFVLCSLWRWFVGRTFGVRELTLAQAIGLWLMLGYLFPALRYLPSAEDNEKQHSLVKDLLLGPVYHLATGWVVHQFQ